MVKEVLNYFSLFESFQNNDLVAYNPSQMTNKDIRICQEKNYGLLDLHIFGVF